MKTKTFKIKKKDGTTEVVEGIIVNDIWGIDKRTTENVTYTSKGEKRSNKSSDYYLTHIPSGMLVTVASTRKTLMEIANLEALMDENDPYAIWNAVLKYWDKRGWKG